MKYLRRLTGWLAGVLLIAALVIGLAIITFFEAMNYSNIQIVLKGGMAYRAQVITGVEPDTDPWSFFTGDLQENDPVHGTLNSPASTYSAYNVVGFDHRLDISFAWIWPKQQEVTLEVTESIPRIDGRAKASTAEALVAAGGQDAVYPPAWGTARYRVTLVQDSRNKQWRIRSITWIADE